MKEDIAAAILRVITEILRPISGIADLNLRPQQGAHLSGQGPQRGHRGKAVACRAYLRQPPHFRGDAKRLDPACCGAKRGIVQDEARQGPFLGAVVDDRAFAHREIRSRDGSEKRRHLSLCRRRTIRAARPPRGHRKRDSSAPRQAGLVLGIAIGVRQPVAFGLIHQDKRVEHHRLARRLQRVNGLDHRGIGWRAAVDRARVLLGDHLCRATRQARDPPRHVLPIDIWVFDLGPQATVTAAQIAAKPRHDERSGFQPWQFLGQTFQGHREIGLGGGRVHIGAPPAAGAVGVMHRGRRQRVFSRAGDQGNPLNPIGGRMLPARRLRLLGAQHLERELRHPVAKLRKREVFHHHIGCAAIGRHPVRALDRGDGRVGLLVRRASVNAHVQIVRGNLLPICPDTPNAGDLPFAERDGKADGIAVFGGLWRRRAALAAAADLGGLLKLRGPDDMPRQSHPPVKLRDRRPLARACQAKAIHLTGLDRLSALAQQALINQSPKARPHCAANRDRRQPRQCAPDGAANRRPRCRKNNRRHQETSSGNTKRATMRRCHGGLSGLSTTPCRA